MKHFKRLQKTGRLAGIGETSTSPTLKFTLDYDDVTVRFELEPGTLRKLEEIGVSDGTAFTRQQFPGMVEGVGPWNKTHARFKTETLKPDGIPQVNIQLGKGKALDVFNDNVKKWTEVSRR